MNLEDMSVEDLTALIDQASQMVRDRLAQAQQAVEDRRAQLAAAITPLEVLLGPDDATPGIDSIRAARAFDTADISDGKPRGTTMAENPGLALSLLFEGMELLTANTLNLARILAAD